MGLEFQDAELDMMLRGVNQALANYETLRKADVPIDTEPAPVPIPPPAVYCARAPWGVAARARAEMPAHSSVR